MATLENLPNHCTNNNCTWCKERRDRRRAQSIEQSKIGIPPTDHWNRKINSFQDILGYWPIKGIPGPLVFNGAAVRYLRERNYEHRIARSKPGNQTGMGDIR